MADRSAVPDIIVTRTPLRVSFAGGGTDLAAFYEQHPGEVFSTAITQYVYVTVKRHSELYLGRPDGPGVAPARCGSPTPRVRKSAR